METPELDKIAAVRGESDTITRFLDYLSSEGICLTFSNYGDGVAGVFTIPKFRPVGLSNEALLAGFFEIDLKKAEEERRAVLEELRTRNEEKP